MPGQILSPYLVRIAEEIEPLVMPLVHQLKGCAMAIYRFYQRHSVLLQQISILTLTMTVFASKVIVSTPKVLAQVALSCLNFVGIISLDSQICHLSKAYDDFSRTHFFCDRVGMLFTLSKVIAAATSIFLTCLFFASSLVALAGMPSFAVGCNLVCYPISLLGWLLSQVNHSVDYHYNTVLLDDFKALKPTALPENQRKIILLVKEMIHIFNPRLNFTFQIEASTPPATSSAYLAMRTIRQLENSSLEQFRGGLALIQPQGRAHIDWQRTLMLFKTVKQRLKEKQLQMYASTGLTLLGHMAMNLSKFYPDSALDWGARTAMSLLYTIKMIWKKICLWRLSEALTASS